MKFRAKSGTSQEVLAVLPEGIQAVSNFRTRAVRGQFTDWMRSARVLGIGLDTFAVANWTRLRTVSRTSRACSSHFGPRVGNRVDDLPDVACLPSGLLRGPQRQWPDASWLLLQPLREYFPAICLDVMRLLLGECRDN